jgi:hypothetical protein
MNEVAELVAEAVPYVTAAVTVYGGAVLEKTKDQAADVTVRAGARFLRWVFGHRTATDTLPGAVADAVNHPGDDAYIPPLMEAIYEVIRMRDAGLLAEARALLDQAKQQAASGEPDLTASHEFKTGKIVKGATATQIETEYARGKLTAVAVVGTVEGDFTGIRIGKSK